jgi:hypothetical protein
LLYCFFITSVTYFGFLMMSSTTSAINTAVARRVAQANRLTAQPAMLTPSSNHLQKDLTSLAGQLTKARPDSTSCLGSILQALSWGVFWEFGEALAHGIIKLLGSLFENMGDILGGLFG